MAKHKKKRYYKVGEIVYVLPKKTTGEVVSLDIANQSMTVHYTDRETGMDDTFTGKFWEFNKNNKNAMKETVRPKNLSKIYMGKDIINIAKTEGDAVIPTKNEEDAGWDFYPTFEGPDVTLYKNYGSNISLGVATYMDTKYALLFNCERGSVGQLDIAVISGLIDSHYQGTITLRLIPLSNNIVIYDPNADIYKNSKIEELASGKIFKTTDAIYYPKTKAIAQAVVLPVPKVGFKEVSYDEILKKPSKRGDGKYGSSGK